MVILRKLPPIPVGTDKFLSGFFVNTVEFSVFTLTLSKNRVCCDKQYILNFNSS